MIENCLLIFIYSNKYRQVKWQNAPLCSVLDNNKSIRTLHCEQTAEIYCNLRQNLCKVNGIFLTGFLNCTEGGIIHSGQNFSERN